MPPINSGTTPNSDPWKVFGSFSELATFLQTINASSPFPPFVFDNQAFYYLSILEITFRKYDSYLMMRVRDAEKDADKPDRIKDIINAFYNSVMIINSTNYASADSALKACNDLLTSTTNNDDIYNLKNTRNGQIFPLYNFLGLWLLFTLYKKNPAYLDQNNIGNVNYAQLYGIYTLKV